MTSSVVPSELRYSKSHEWIRIEGGEAVLGITDHAQQELTDIVFADLPKVGSAVKAGSSAMVLESVKTVADIYTPVDGTITAVNDGLKAHPELINRAPYAEGWLFRVRPSAAMSESSTLSAAEYSAFLASLGA